MSIEEKIKYQYMKILYDKLNLKGVENSIRNIGIKSKKIIGDERLKVGEYFFLYNNVTLNRLNPEEKNKINQYFSCDIIDLNNSSIIEEVNQFLINNLFKILLPETESKTIHYGIYSPNKVLPADSICFVCHYIKYDDDNKEKITNLYKILNYIQNVMRKESNIKLAIIPCDEITSV